MNPCQALLGLTLSLVFALALYRVTEVAARMRHAAQLYQAAGSHHTVIAAVTIGL